MVEKEKSNKSLPLLSIVGQLTRVFIGFLTTKPDPRGSLGYGGPEGSFPSGNERRHTCAAAMSGSARTGAAMGGPGQQCAETLGFERKQAE